MKLKTNLSIILCSIQKSPAKRKNSGNRWNERNILILIYHKISLNKQDSLLEYCKRIVQIKWNKLQSSFCCLWPYYLSKILVACIYLLFPSTVTSGKKLSFAHNNENMMTYKSHNPMRTKFQYNPVIFEWFHLKIQ